jgi:hypothetical protein
MEIGVLTSDGVMYLLLVKKKIKDDDIGDFISEELGESANCFNWQVLKTDDGQPNPTLNFRIVEVD